MQRRKIIFWAKLAGFAVLCVLPQPSDSAPNNTPIPDFSGIWRHGTLPWLISPASGPGPVTNLSRRADDGTSDYSQLVGDYRNPILQPWAADVVRQEGNLSLAGKTFPSPSNQCWPEPPPYLFKHMEMQMLQRPDHILMIFNEDHEVRLVRLNQPHPAHMVPSWHGDSIGHYEGDALVVDTIGIKPDRPYAMIDLFGTPFTASLHVVERYRLVDLAAAKPDLDRQKKENWRPGGPIDPHYNGKFLKIEFTIDDPGAFTTPWTASMIYLRDNSEWPEVVCAENPHVYYDQDEKIPTAQKPDF